MRVHSSASPTTSAPSAEPQVKPRRPRWLRIPRWHWLTWLVLIGPLVPLFLLEVPGYGVTPTLLTAKPFPWGSTSGGPMPNPDEAEGPLSVSEFVHGWPWTYLRRASGSGGKGWPKSKYADGKTIIGSRNGGSLAPWDWSPAWWSRIDAAQWSFISLLGDLATVIAIVGGAVWACQTWIRRRGHRFRLRIVDLLGVMLMVGVVFGWRQWHLRLQAREAHFLTSGPMVESGFWRHPVREYCGPEWMARLVGSHRLPWCRHVTSLQIDCQNATAAQWTQLRRLCMVQDINLWNSLPEEGLAALEKLPRLRRLSLVVRSSWEPEWPVSPGKQPTPVLTPDDLSPLGRLPHLESIGLSGKTLLIEDMEEVVAALPSIREISVQGITATMAEQHAFRDAHPELVVLCDEEEEKSTRYGGI